jgi:hypothetical protein|tara:strand:- start:931 stop:1170 length:240 start_codon:yes stop_codon:yes gene_type:complete
MGYFIVKDGVWRELTSTQFETEFGYTPTDPRATEKLFGGRYEHNSFVSGAINEETGLVDAADQVVKNSADSVFGTSGSI